MLMFNKTIFYDHNKQRLHASKLMRIKTEWVDFEFFYNLCLFTK